MQLASLELHLLFVELVLNDIRASLSAREATRLLLPLLLLIELVGGDRDTLAMIIGFLAPALPWKWSRSIAT